MSQPNRRYLDDSHEMHDDWLSDDEDLPQVQVQVQEQEQEPRNLVAYAYDKIATPTQSPCQKKCCKPIYDLPLGTLGECAICYDSMDMINIAITECGHSFHFSCLAQNMLKRVQCPLCRAELIEAAEDDDEDDDDEDDEDEDDEDEEEEPAKVSIPQLANKLTNLGYTLEDVLMMFCGSNHPVDETNPRWSTVASHSAELFTWNVGSTIPYTDSEDRPIPKPVNVVDRLNRDFDLIMDGTITVAHRDRRSYADVVVVE